MVAQRIFCLKQEIPAAQNTAFFEPISSKKAKFCTAVKSANSELKMARLISLLLTRNCFMNFGKSRALKGLTSWRTFASVAAGIPGLFVSSAIAFIFSSGLVQAQTLTTFVNSKIMAIQSHEIPNSFNGGVARPCTFILVQTVSSGTGYFALPIANANHKDLKQVAQLAFAMDKFIDLYTVPAIAACGDLPQVSTIVVKQ
jgi:hypothetical protein